MEDSEAAIRDFDTRDINGTLGKFKVTITEKLKLNVEVKAKDQQEAEQIVSDCWRNGGYILSADNFVDVEFDAVPVDDPVVGEAKRYN